MHTGHLNDSHLLVEVRSDSCKVRDNRVAVVVCEDGLAHDTRCVRVEDTY
jgi:hypothetical protein